MPFIHYPHQRSAEVECELKRANLPGYTDPSHFARAFRRLAGVSPREYLQKIQE
jgi:YesN/AraC family two-component response regulator